MNIDYNDQLARSPKKLTESSEYKNSLYGRNVSEELLDRLTRGLLLFFYKVNFYNFISKVKFI